jgi:2-methylaconitate cis-trans-isomerase PrpF
MSATRTGADGVRCMLMRGGTSKGAYFLAGDLPAQAAERDDLILRIMGSPDPRQIDGIGGGHPLTSKVAVISPSVRDDADVDYLFLQVGVGEAVVTDRQNCGNLLAGVAPFAVERGLAAGFPVRIRMVNSGELATATSPEPGVVVLEFAGTAGPLLPTGHLRDVIDGVDVTCVDAGMPVVVVAARDLGRTGYETISELEADEDLLRRVTALRLAAGELMGLGDVSGATVPKVSLVASPKDGGMICTRTFIPVRVHESIGVLGAVSVARAVLLDGAVGHELAAFTPGQSRLDIEHPSGRLQLQVESDPPRAGVVRTARKLFDGFVFPREKP